MNITDHQITAAEFNVLADAIRESGARSKGLVSAHHAGRDARNHRFERAPQYAAYGESRLYWLAWLAGYDGFAI